MYFVTTMTDTVRIPPERLGEEYEPLALSLAREMFERTMDGKGNYTLMIADLQLEGDARIAPGDGGVYQSVKYDALMFRPVQNEVVDGEVVEVMKFGAFVRFGPLDGLVHISQIIDDKVDIDLENQRLLGKEKKWDLKKGDKVRGRIISISLNQTSPRESRIGLTMRQPGLGKLEWLEEKRAEKEAKK